MNVDRVVAWSLAALGGLSFLKWATTTSVFVSYHCRDDAAPRRLLQAWSRNPAFDIEFDDVSLDASIASGAEADIRRAIGERLDCADVFLCIVGRRTSSRPWVAYEIAEARARSLPIVAVKRSRHLISPPALLGAGATWVHSFRYTKIRDAIRNAL